MYFRSRSKKVLSSLLAVSILSTAVVSGDSLPLKKLIPTNTFSASAAKISGSWEYEEITRYTAKLTKYTGSSSNVLIPESIGGRTVKELGNDIFADNASIKTVSIPRGISTIPKRAFLRCDNLKTVNIPPTVTTIEEEAFRGTAIETIYLPSSLQTLGEAAFYLCRNLKTVNMPSCQSIEDDAFMQCSSLTSIKFPSNLQYLGENIFERTPIENIKLTNSDARSFSTKAGALSSYSLTNIDVPNAEIFGVLLRDRSLKNTRNLLNVNGSQLVQYTSSRFGPYTLPYIRSDYFAKIQENLASVDADRIGFFEQYLDKTISYSVMEATCYCRSDGEKIKAIHDWVCKKVDFDYLPNGKENHALYNHIDSSVFMRDKTVCDGYARAMVLMLNKAGIEAYFTSSNTHAWAIVSYGDHYFHLDACHDDLMDPVSYDHFLKSDTYISNIGRCSKTSHATWEVSTATNANYPASRIDKTFPYGTPRCRYSMGDANRNGVVDFDDVYLIQNVIRYGSSNYFYDGTLADADLDGEITIGDVYAIREIASNS